MKEIIKRKIKDNMSILYIMLIISIILLYLITMQNCFDIQIECGSNVTGAIQVYYCDNKDLGFDESKSVCRQINDNSISNIVINSDRIVRLRVDFEECDVLILKKISVAHMGKNLLELNIENFSNYVEYTNNCLIETDLDALKLVSTGSDSHIAFRMENIECSKMYKFIKKFLVPLLYLCICGVVLIIFSINEEDKLANENYRFIVLASLFGLIYSFTITRWQIPDERTHLRMIGEGFNNLKYIGIVDGTNYSIVDLLPKGISKEFFRHFPSAIGILCGILLNLSPYWIVQLGELTSLVFYIIICNQALKLTPIKKSLFEVVMLLPMCIQQASSINYDAVLLPLSFFYIAYILYLKFEKQRIIVKDFMILGIVITIVAVIKLPYGVMGLMLLMLPWEKIHFGVNTKKIRNSSKLLRVYGGGILTVLILSGLYIFRNYYYVKLLITSIMYIPRTIQIFLNTLEARGDFLLRSLLGNFGILDTPIPWFLAMVIFSILVFSTLIKVTDNTKIENEKKFSVFDKVVIIVSVMLVVYMVSISMISHTVGLLEIDYMDNNTVQGFKQILNTISFIDGLQGRYYIPLLLPFLILFPDLFEVKKRTYNKYIFMVENIVLVFTSFVLIKRYLI